jgi:GTPase SAR1 family protein
MYDATDPSSLTSLRTWMEDAQSYTYNATFLLLGNKYDDSDDHDSASGSSYQVDDDLSKAFASHNEIPLHFKISTQCSNEETLMNVFQSLAEQMHRQMERQYLSAASRGGGDYPLTCTTCTDTVHLIATETNTNTQSSCTPCSRR